MGLRLARVGLPREGTRVDVLLVGLRPILDLRPNIISYPLLFCCP